MQSHVIPLPNSGVQVLKTSHRLGKEHDIFLLSMLLRLLDPDHWSDIDPGPPLLTSRLLITLELASKCSLKLTKCSSLNNEFSVRCRFLELELVLTLFMTSVITSFRETNTLRIFACQEAVLVDRDINFYPYEKEPPLDSRKFPAIVRHAIFRLRKPQWWSPYR